MFVRNPAPTPREVIVDLMDGESSVATSGPKGLPVPGNSTVAVPVVRCSPPEGGPGVAGGGAEPPAAAPRRGRPGQEFDVQPLQPTIAAPEVRRAMQAHFVPACNGKPNQLKVSLLRSPR